MHYQVQMYDKVISQLVFNEGENKETPFVFHTPQNHSHKKFNGF